MITNKFYDYSITENYHIIETKICQFIPSKAIQSASIISTYPPEYILLINIKHFNSTAKRTFFLYY